MPLSYNGKRIIPAPLVTIAKNYINQEDGKKLGVLYDITLTGTILSSKGSPSGNYADINNAFWTFGGYPPDESYTTEAQRFNSVLRKQEALRKLFSEDGKSLEWQPTDGSPVVKCNPRLLNINFEEGRGQWVEGTDYTVSLQADWLFINGTTNVEDNFSNYLLQSATENWSFEEIQGRENLEYNVTHSINAKALFGFDENGDPYLDKTSWQHAQDYVNTKISGSIDPAVMFAVVGSSGWFSGQRVRTFSIDKNDGAFGATETWLLKQNEDAFIEKNFSVDFRSEAGDYSVKYTGNIFGFTAGVETGAAAILEHAKAFIPTDAQARTETQNNVQGLINGNTIPDFPDSKSFVLNRIDGTVSFTFEWASLSGSLVTQEFEVTVNFSSEEGVYTLTLNQSITGRGTDQAVRLENARDALLSDTQAFNKAIDLADDALPDDVVENILKSRSVAINEKQGSVRASWTWDSTLNEEGLEIIVRTQLPSDVFASIPIVGRAVGPVIQNMNTLTSEIVNVSINGKRQTVKPDGPTIALAQLSDPDDYLISSQEESYNAVKQTYEYRGSFLKFT